MASINPQDFVKRFGGDQGSTGSQMGSRYGLEPDKTNLGTGAMDYGQAPSNETFGRNSSGRPAAITPTFYTPPTNMAS